MDQSVFFDEELARLRLLWVLAVKRGDGDAVRVASTAYFCRARELTGETRGVAHSDS
jgi:hypothetical protein